MDRAAYAEDPASASAGEAVAAVSGSASDLLLLLWRRLPPEALQVAGDDAAVRRFLSRTDLE